jgi:hypothetical protein
MDGFGNSAVTAGARHGDALQAAAFPDGNFHFDAFADDALPYDGDLDAAFPVSLPEDPFPEALFAGRPFDGDLLDDGVPSGNGTSWHVAPGSGVHDRGTTPGWFLPAADLTADSAGLIDQVRRYENVKCWAAGQQARLSVAFEARLRLESTDRPPLAEDLGKDRGTDRDLGAAEQIALARGESPNCGRPTPWSKGPPVHLAAAAASN